MTVPPGQPPQPYQPHQPQPWGPPPVDLGTRFVARLIDFILLGVATAVIAFVMALVRVLLTFAGPSMPDFGRDGFGLFPAASTSALSALLYVGYFTLMESTRGQTIGKMITKIAVVGPEGRTPTLEQALKRNLWTGVGVLTVLPFLGSLAAPLLWLVAAITIATTISSSPVNRGWHDNFAGGTSVVRTG